MNGLVISSVDPASVEVALDAQIDMPAVAFVGIDDGEVAGAGGLAWGAGRCWIWFMTRKAPKPSYAFAAIRMARLMFRKAAQLGETEVYTTRDARYASSLKLLTMLSFEHVGMEQGHELWKRRV